MFVLFISMLHAIPILMVSRGSNSRSWTIATAVLMVVIGVATGSPAYMAGDLIAVGLALWLFFPKAVVSSSPAQQLSYPLASGDRNMGFLSAMRLSSIYDKRIESLGFEPRSLPPDLHSTICSSFERRAVRFADMGNMTGQLRSNVIEGAIEAAADLLVLCCIGPTALNRKLDFYPNGAADIISNLAKTWIRSGWPEGSIELMLVHTVNQAGFLNIEFAQALKAERARQMLKKEQEDSGSTAHNVATDVATGTATGYAEKAEALGAARLARAAARIAAASPVTPIGVILAKKD